MASPPVLTPTQVTVEPSLNFVVVEADVTTFAIVESSLNSVLVTNPQNAIEIFC